MPKTRNITRAQWDATSTSTSARQTTSSRQRRKQNENIYESEKENKERISPSATRSQTRSRVRATPLGTSNATVLGASAAGKNLGEKTRTASKGKGKPPKAPLKQRKMPLQDITDQFLPAPEAANRGERTEDIDNEEGPVATPRVNRVLATAPPSEGPRTIPLPKFTSPLPPSSPPSESLPTPLLLKQSAPELLDNLHYSSQPTFLQEPHDPWAEFDAEHGPSQDSPAQVSSNSDPFGFVSLERKLKAERKAAATLETPRHLDDEEEEGAVLVADTSSPRPVRRLKRPVRGDAEAVSVAAEIPLPPPTCVAPPSPHKDKHKKRRLSAHEGHDIFSPCDSSVESSPSPSKTSARKRPAPNMHSDPLDEFNEEFDRSYEVEKTLKRPRSKEQILEPEAKDEDGSVDPSPVRRKLRPREKHQLPDEKNDKGQGEIKATSASIKVKVSKRLISKSRAVGKKEKAEANNEEEGEDFEEKWERERQERVEFFKRLEDYHVEKEDVYFI